MMMKGEVNLIVTMFINTLKNYLHFITNYDVCFLLVIVFIWFFFFFFNFPQVQGINGRVLWGSTKSKVIYNLLDNSIKSA
jgi:hypothetical protein